MTSFLDRLRELGEQAAQPPVWTHARGAHGPVAVVYGKPGPQRERIAGYATRMADYLSPEDAEFIVAARNLWQPILNVIEAAQRIPKPHIAASGNAIYLEQRESWTLWRALDELERAVEATHTREQA